MQTIELKDHEAKTFLAFRENQIFFEELIKAGVHNLKNGNAVLSFDPVGKLSKIRVEQVVYKR